nr:hypothetical protein [Tanacetum cinerariifolium]
MTGADEGTGTIPGVLDVPIYESKSEKESWGDSGEEDEDDENDYVDKSDDDDNDGCGNDNHDDDSVEKKTEIDRDEIPEPNLTNVTKELYDDVNVNLGKKDTEMTNADQGALEQQNASQQSGFEQEEEDAHVTLTHVVDKQKTRGP